MKFKNLNLELTNADKLQAAITDVDAKILEIGKALYALQSALSGMGVKITPAVAEPIEQEIGLDIADEEAAHIEFETIYDGFQPAEGSIKLILSADDWRKLAGQPAFSALLDALETQGISGGKRAADEIRGYLEKMKERRL